MPQDKKISSTEERRDYVLSAKTFTFIIILSVLIIILSVLIIIISINVLSLFVTNVEITQIICHNKVFRKILAYECGRLNCLTI